MPKKCVKYKLRRRCAAFFRFDILEQAFIMEIEECWYFYGSQYGYLLHSEEVFFYAKTIQMLPTSMSGASAIALH